MTNLSKRPINFKTIDLISRMEIHDGLVVMAWWDDAFDKLNGYLTDDQLIELNNYLASRTLN